MFLASSTAAMARKSVPAILGAEIALWVPALCLVVFLIVHFTLFGLVETLGGETFLLSKSSKSKKERAVGTREEASRLRHRIPKDGTPLLQGWSC